eukprot:UN31709
MADKCFETASQNVDAGWDGCRYFESIMYTQQEIGSTRHIAMKHLLDLLVGQQEGQNSQIPTVSMIGMQNESPVVTNNDVEMENTKNGSQKFIDRAFSNIQRRTHNTDISFDFIHKYFTHERMKTERRKLEEHRRAIEERSDEIAEILMIDFVLVFAKELTDDEMSIIKKNNVSLEERKLDFQIEKPNKRIDVLKQRL